MAESFDARIQHDHALITLAVLAGHDVEREFAATDIAEAVAARAVFEAARRALSKAHARALYSGDVESAGRLSAQITELEAHQP